MEQSIGQGKKSTRVVLDTNVLISALLFKKKLGIICNLIDEGKIIPCFTKTTFLELQTTLQHPKFKLLFKEASFSPKQLIDAIKEKSIIHSDPKRIPKVSRHFPDNFILPSALSCSASFIVSGDKHLLSLKEFKEIPIFSPKQFLNKIKNCEPQG
jgi:putative PIN family toxin of toxin-antitoxin system